ncbi:MAG: glycerophosphodiester phosphodiesterase family protein [Chthoniobacteraceae bacterium]
MRNFLCIGHRGARGLEPENTLRSIRKALALGVDGVEIDVYAVEDQLVVIHDETLERTTNGTGRVEVQSFEYLRSLDAGNGEKIPTLREVLDTVDRRAFVNIELKGRETAALTSGLIREYMDTHAWKEQDFLVSSFDLDELGKLKNTGIRSGVLFTKPPANYAVVTKSLDAYSVNIAVESANEAFVLDAHHHGLKVFVYTVNSIDGIKRMQAIGADGVFTDYPDRMA